MHSASDFPEIVCLEKPTECRRKSEVFLLTKELSLRTQSYTNVGQSNIMVYSLQFVV